MSEKLLNEYEAAERLGLSVRTLRIWRSRGGPVPYIKIGAACRYRPSDLEAVINKGVRTSTSDPGPAR